MRRRKRRRRKEEEEEEGGRGGGGAGTGAARTPLPLGWELAPEDGPLRQPPWGLGQGWGPCGRIKCHVETSCPSPSTYLPWPGGTAVGEGAEEGPGSSQARAGLSWEPVGAFSGEREPQPTQPLLTQATGWGPQQKGSRLNLKNVPEE